MARFGVSSLLTMLLGLAGLGVTAVPASAAPSLSITPITWNVVGLDSNRPTTDGPDTFASGARVCNTGDAPATNLVSTYVWDTNNAYINSAGLTTLTEPTLAAGACTDFYYNIAITRSALAYGQTRRFHITATADGLGTVSTPTPREIYVESLVSQNRNQIVSITGPSSIVVGNTYTYVLTSNTSSTFEQWSSFLNFPNTAFQIKSVSATYTDPLGSTNDTIYADACGFQSNPTLANYRECVGPANFPGGKVGGTAVTTYQVKILSPGGFNINALIYDLSGGSYHYNSDWGSGGKAVTATEEVDLSITKTDSADPVIAGNNLTYTITATNAGPSTARNVTISDPLPAGTSFVAASNGGTNTAGTVSWSIGDLAAGASVSRTLTVMVNPSRTTPISNTASVSTTTTETNPANNSATQATVVNTSADLSLTKTDAADPVARGSNVSYTLTASNAGPSDAQAVTITDTLPASVAFVSATPSQGSCSQAAGILTCSMGTIAAGASATVGIVITPNVDGAITNTASVSSTTSDPSGGNNSASQGTTITPASDVSLTKTGSVDPVVAGNDLTYTITATNAGPSTAQNVQVADPIPTGTDFVSASNGATPSGGTVTWSLGDLAPGASVVRTLTVSVHASRTNPVSNTATVSTTTVDPANGNDSATQNTAVSTSADLSLTKTDDADPVAVGSNVTYTLTVANAGPSDATSVQVSDPLPAGVSYVSATPSQGGPCSFAAGTVSCPLGTIAAGGSASVAVVVRGDADGPVTNTASVTSATSDPDDANDGASQGTTFTSVADVRISKTDSVDPVTAGTDLTYTLTATNDGPSTAQDVQISDAIPAGTSFVSASGGGTLAAGTVTWNLGNVASGASVVRTLTVHVDASRTAALANTGTVSTTTFDPSNGNDSATQTTQVETSADLAVTKTDSADPVAVSQNVVYTLAVHNSGPSDAAGVQVSDTLPAGMTFVSATAPCGYAAGTVTCNLGSLAAGGDATVSVTVTPVAEGKYTNTATVSSTTPDPSNGNDSDTETTDATPVTDLSISKTDGVPSVTAGTSTTYTITVTNDGPSAVPAGVEITDALPPGVTGSESEADCDLVGQTLTCTTGAGLAVGASVSFEVDVAVDADFAGATLANTATITGSPHVDPDAVDDEATDTDLVDRVADLGVSLDDTPDPVVLGNDVTYTLQVDNAGPSDAANVLVAGVLPAGLGFVSGPGGCTLVLGILACDAGTVPAGGGASFDVVLRPLLVGAVALDATVTSATFDANAANDTDIEGTTVLAPPPADVDLGVSLADAPDPVAESGVLIYTLGVENASPNDADGVELVQQLPPTATFQSASGGCSEALGVVTCTVGSLNGGASANASVVVRAPASVQALASTVSVTTTSNDTNAANDSATAATAMVAGPGGPASADLGVVVTDTPDPVDAGGSVTYSIGVDNLGPDDATDVVVTFALPPGASFTSATPLQGSCSQAGGVVTCDLGDLATGASTSISVDAVLTLEGTATATASVGSAVADPVPANDAASTTTTVNPVADLSVAKTDGVASVAAGTSTTYTITLSNAGPSTAAAGVVVVDQIPAGTTAHVTDPSCSIAGTDVTCVTIAPLAAGSSVSWQVTLDVPANHATPGLDNTAAIQSSPTPDPVVGNDSATDHDDVTPATADVSIFKQDVPDPVIAGGTIRYTITVTNDGPGDATDVVVTDAVPAHTTVETIEDGGTEAGGVVTWNLGTLTAGQSVSVHLVVEVDVNHDGDVSNTATVTSSAVDSDPSDDSATAVTTDDPAGVDLDLAKEVDQDSVAVGDVVTYTITVSNAGPADATGVVVKDALPKGLEYLSSKASTGSYDEDTGRWTVGDLGAGDDAELAIRTRITGAAASTLKNVATVAGLDQTDDTPANDQAEAEVDVLGSDVEIVDPISDGEELAFTGFALGLACRIALLLLILGVALTSLGRRLERAPRRNA